MINYKIKILVIILVLTGCTSIVDYRQAQAIAVSKLSANGYNLADINISPKVILKDTIKEVSAEYFMLSGEYKTVPGFYSSTERAIYLYKYCGKKIATHEYMHDLLFQAGVPISEHHKIMDGL